MRRTHLTTTELLEVLALRVKAAGSQRRFAEEVGVSQAYLCDVIRGRREPGPKLAAALGFPVLERVFSQSV